MEPIVSFLQAPIVVRRAANFRLMIHQTHSLRSGFASRLNEICDDMRVPHGRGRTAHVAKLFKVTPNAVRKWFLGIGYPEMEMAIQLANWAGVNVTWLLQGTGLKRGATIDTKAVVLGEAIESLPRDDRQQVLDFIEYKFAKSDGLFVGERLARYLVMIDAFKKDRDSKE
jgi:transcriptional regulator with XRE-family HTH domain